MERLLILIVFTSLVILPSAFGQQSQPADLILHNGTIWTVDSKNSVAQAVAIRAGKFVVVGSNAAALSLRGPKTQVIDLQGRFVTPGFQR